MKKEMKRHNKGESSSRLTGKAEHSLGPGDYGNDDDNNDDDGNDHNGNDGSSTSS